MNKLQELIIVISDYVDSRDVCTFGGLAMVWYGLSVAYPPAAWVVVGAALFWIGAH